jgi:hypothetical protein
MKTKPSKIKLFYTKLIYWEYWPFKLVYLPVLVYYLWLSLKAKSFFFFSASNPSIETGGMLGESKFSILKNIPEDVKAFTLFFHKNTTLPQITSALQENNLIYPIIAKPDVGERGTMVEKINNETELTLYIKNNKTDFLIQEYVNFTIELGVFYYRFPDQPGGTVSSVVMKDFLKVTGDGQSTLGELIARYPRAGFQFERLNTKLNYDSIPAKETIVLLEPIGNHCRGTTFLNANDIIDQKLITIFDNISLQISGFFFGRYDLRCKSIEDLKAGKNIKIVELNGAGAEPGHIYQPGYSIFKAWKELLFHWKILYQISIQNHRKGISYMSFSEVKNKYKEIQLQKKSA